MTGKPIRVLQVMGTMNRGGAEALLMNLLRTVDRSELQFDFVEQTQERCDYDDEIEALGATIYRCPSISMRNLREYRRWWRDFFAAHPEYAIVHGHSRGSAPVYLDEANKAGRITIAHCHNNSHGRGVAGAKRFLWQLQLRNLADYNLACSHDSGVSQFGKHGTFQIVRNGIQTEKYAWNPLAREEVRVELDIQSDAFVVGNVARFEQQKNHAFLLEVFAAVKETNPNSMLLLVGDGSLAEAIHEKARELGIEDSIVYAGVRSDVERLLQAMDVFVMPSLFEGLGIALIEAQAAGLPCFASKKLVAPEAQVTDLLTYVSLKSSPRSWARKILKDELPQRRETRQEVINAGFDIQTTAQWLDSFYKEILIEGKK